MFDYELDDRLFESYTVKFSIPATDPKAEHLVEDAIIEVDHEPFYITSVLKVRDGEKTTLEVQAESSWLRLADIKRVGSFELSHRSVRGGLNTILRDTGWTVDQVPTDTTTLRSLESEDSSVLDLVWQWAHICGCEVSFDTRESRITFLPQIGANLGLGFRYGRNLTQIKRTTTPPTATRLYAYGRSDITIADLNGGLEYLEDYSFYTAQGLTLEQARLRYRKDEIYSDSSILSDGELLNVAEALMAVKAQPTVKYESTVVDLSSILDTPTQTFRCGDTVYVYDEVLGFDVNARVTRILRYPTDPTKNRIELTVGVVEPPTSNVSSSRSATTANWELFESRNTTTYRQVRSYYTVLNRVGLNAGSTAEWVVGYKLQGTGVGTGEITLSAEDEETFEEVWPTQSFPVADGEPFEWNFTFGGQDISQGEHTVAIRAISDGDDVGVNIPPKQTALWILARGMTRRTIALPNEVIFGKYQYPPGGGNYRSGRYLWVVPDDVTEILIEAVGARGSTTASRTPGYGGLVRARFPVTAGDYYHIYVPTRGGNTEGWPNGGYPQDGSGRLAGGGGGSASVQPYLYDGLSNPTDPEDTGNTTALTAGSTMRSTFLATLPDALIVAGGGGGTPVSSSAQSGHGSFYGGLLSDCIHPPFPGSGATQFTGGVGSTSDETGTFGFAGFGYLDATTSQPYGGGGGGGWYGGAAGAHTGGNGGGGGSGWVHESAYDLEFEDGYNQNHGYVKISWAELDV